MLTAKTPLRISFAGGITDMKKFYGVETGAVLSSTIDKFVYLMVNSRYDGGFRLSYSQVEETDDIDSIKHPLIRESLRLFPTRSVDVSSLSDIPAATGLGSSGAYTVGLLNAMSVFSCQFVTKEELAQAACEVEQITNEESGKQDQYAAAFGGLNLIEFNPDGTVYVKPVMCSDEVADELSRNLMMFYLGVRQTSSSSIMTTYNFEDNWQALRDMRELAYELKLTLEEGKNLADFGNLLADGWRLKKTISSEISHEDVDCAYDVACHKGALGGKLCGAGQRGFLLLYCERHNQANVRKALKPLVEIQFRLHKQGSVIYKC